MLLPRITYDVLVISATLFHGNWFTGDTLVEKWNVLGVNMEFETRIGPAALGGEGGAVKA